MAPVGLLFSKNDSGFNSVQNLRWWGFSNCLSFQNVATLLRRLQAQGACAHQSQQSFSLHENNKLEFSSSLVGPRTLTVSFSNRLLPGQGKWSCKCTVSFFSEKQRWKGKVSGWKHSNSSSLAVFTNKCHFIKSIHVSQFEPIAAPSGLYLRNLRPTAATSILGHVPLRASQ